MKLFSMCCVVVLFIGLIVMSVHASAAPEDEGKTFRGNLKHHGVYSSGIAKIRKKGYQGMALRWRFETKGHVRGSAAVANGIIYIGSGDGCFYAIDDATGTERWRYEAGEPIASTASIWNGGVYFTDRSGNLYCLDLATGALKFKVAVTVKGERDPYMHLHSSPTILDGIAYYGAYDGFVYAVDAKTGAKKWTFNAGGHIHSSPAIDEGVLYIASNNGLVFAIDISTGVEKWRFKGSRAFVASPTIGDGMVYIPNIDSNFYALDIRTGKKVWTYNKAYMWLVTTPTLVDETVIIGSSDAGVVVAIDAKTGLEKWRFDASVNVFSSPSVSDGFVFAAGWDGYLHVIDLKTGKAVGYKHGMEGQIQSSPVIVDGSLYVGCDDHCLYKMN